MGYIWFSEAGCTLQTGEAFTPYLIIEFPLAPRTH